MRLLNKKEIRRMDQWAIEEYGIPGMVLMENAGSALAEEAAVMLREKQGQRIVVVTGGGNNGGDGFVAARHLHNMGYGVRIFMLTPGEKLKGDARANWEIIAKMGIKTQLLSDERRLSVLKVVLLQADLLIDCLFGTGLEENIRGLALPLIQLINESKCPVLACDIPSGLCADKGLPLAAAVRAEATLTFGYGKIGLYLPGAQGYTGRVKVADISLPKEMEERLPLRRELLDADFCRRWLAPREKQSHKGNYGHLLLWAGSKDMPGAAMLAAAGALRMGVGLLSAALPPEARAAFSTRLPEAMLLDAPEPKAEGGGSPAAAVEELIRFPASAYLIGPGLGRSPETGEMIRALLPKLPKGAVLDADALYALVGYEDLLPQARHKLVLTPHPGEMARLCGISIGELQKNRVEAAVEFAAKSKAVVVLKGAGTVIADPKGRIFLNSNGNPGMATGGSGDVLAGMIGALLAQGLPASIAAACGVWLHGAAGDMAAAAKSRIALLPRDICEYLPMVQRNLNQEL